MMQYSDVLEDIKRGFMIIGLTGYTASGCSAFKEIIIKENKPEAPDFDNIKDRITKESFEKLGKVWKNLDWEPFNDIEVSLVIWMFVIRQAIRYNYKNEIYANVRRFINPYKNELQGVKYLTSKHKLSAKACKSLIKSYEFVYNNKNDIKVNVFGRQNLYNMIKFLQNSGTQIRRYGKPSPNNYTKASPENITIFPEALRKIIRAYRYVEQKKYFVIDAFRNPFEIEYFKRRYKEFYLINVNRAEELRLKSLYKNQIRDFECTDIYKTEKCENIKEKRSKNIEKWITSQNINECSQKSEYYINNNTNDFQNLKLQAIKIITLYNKPGCIPPSQDELFMQFAMSARQKSGCLSRKVGAILANDERVVGFGWNDPPKGQTPCLLRSSEHISKDKNKYLFSAYELGSEFVDHIKDKYNDSDIPFCFKDEFESIQKNKFPDKNIGKQNEFTRALHAEERAFLSNTSFPSAEELTLYTTDSPCTLCAKKAYHLNVKRIVYIEEYPGISNQQTLFSGERSDSINLENFEGAIGSTYFQLYESVMPEKDYIKLFL